MRKKIKTFECYRITDGGWHCCMCTALRLLSFLLETRLLLCWELFGIESRRFVNEHVESSNMQYLPVAYADSEVVEMRVWRDSGQTSCFNGKKVLVYHHCVHKLIKPAVFSWTTSILSNSDKQQHYTMSTIMQHLQLLTTGNILLIKLEETLLCLQSRVWWVEEASSVLRDSLTESKKKL